MPRDSISALITADHLCHPTLRQRPFTRAGWLFELKHDGFRALVIKQGRSARILSRTGRSMHLGFPELAASLSELGRDAVLDCELVVPDTEGNSDFEALRQRNLLNRSELIVHAAASRPAVLVCFDVLAARGQDLRSLPLGVRRDWLHANVSPVRGLQLIESVETHGEALYQLACEQDREGIVAKRLDSAYRAGRQDCWIKTKNKAFSRQAAVVWQA